MKDLGVRFPDLRPTLRELRIDVLCVLRAANLSPGILGQTDARVTTEQFFAFWRALAEECGDPLVGVELACRLPLAQHHPACIVAEHARTFRDALARLARYKSLCCGEDLRMDDNGTECRVTVARRGVAEAMPVRLVDAVFANAVNLGRRGTRRAIHPVRVELARPWEAAERFESFYGSRVRFRARRDAIIFRTSDLEQPFASYNEALAEMLTAGLDQQLVARRPARSVSEQVKWVAQRMVGVGLPQLAEIAHELAVSPRTLQRRVAEEGLNFRQLLVDARRELAHRYLRQPSLSLNETACLLGFEDPNSFFRAFRSWEGITPGEWRIRQQVAP